MKRRRFTGGDMSIAGSTARPADKGKVGLRPVCSQTTSRKALPT